MKINIDTKKLKTTTDEAIAEGKLREEQHLAEVEAKAERQRKIDELKAQNIIGQVPHRAAKEAEAGRSWAEVMSLKWNEDYTGASNNSLSYKNLKGAAVIVWDACREAGLNPTLEYWHDGQGMESGYNIVIRW